MNLLPGHTEPLETRLALHLTDVDVRRAAIPRIAEIGVNTTTLRKQLELNRRGGWRATIKLDHAPGPPASGFVLFASCFLEAAAPRRTPRRRVRDALCPAGMHSGAPSRADAIHHGLQIGAQL
jgi:hypothetical protein